MRQDDEREIAQALDQQRKADEASAPPFHATLERARQGRVSRGPAFRPALAAAALLIVVAGFLFFESKHPPAPARPVPAPSSAENSLASWESPTHFLLDTPGSELWRGLPRLPESPSSIPPTDSRSPKKGVPS